MAKTMKYKVVLGKSWDELEANVEGEGIQPEALVNSIVKGKEVANRHVLSVAIVAGLATALLIATAWGWHDGNFSGLQQTWATGSVPLGWVLGHYFGKNGSRS